MATSFGSRGFILSMREYS